ncbi:hypothetical protein Agub_g15350, partial [Astrephomene gubernaculifera]
MTEKTSDSALERLKRDAEREMRRNLDDGRPSKRPKHEDGSPAFIPVDRYHYSVVGELEAGAKGFLITCNFRKEKSATREAVQLLRRHMPDHLFPQQQQEGQPEEQGQEGTKDQQQEGQQQEGQEGQLLGKDVGKQERRGVYQQRQRQQEVASDDEDDEEEEACAGGLSDATNAAGPVTAAETTSPSAFGLAKVGCRGVVLVRLSAAAASLVQPARLVGQLLREREAGELGQPRHCHRIIPLDATCALTAEGLTRAVATAADAYRRRRQADSAAIAAAAGDSDSANDVTPPFTYTVVYHSRATEPTAAADGGAAPSQAAGAATAATTGASNEPAAAAAAAAAAPGSVAAAAEDTSGGAHATETLSDRGRIISLAAAGMAAAFGGRAKVQLKNPQAALFVEAVPVAGRYFAGVSLLEQPLFVAKGKLLVKPLVTGKAR